jgi:hypothetical protein
MQWRSCLFASATSLGATAIARRLSAQFVSGRFDGPPLGTELSGTDQWPLVTLGQCRIGRQATEWHRRRVRI